MAPKKKGAAPAMTPEQIAAKRAAAMAMFNTGSTAKPDPKPKPLAFAKPEKPPEKEVAALDISDEPKAAASLPRQDAADDAAADERARARAGDAGFVGGEGLSTSLPSAEQKWVTILTVEPMPAMVKKAKKEGEVKETENGCKIYNLKDVAYLYDAEGRTNAACWRTKIEGANLGTGAQPKVRMCEGTSQKKLIGKDEIMLKALTTHSKATITMLPSSHVSVLGDEAAVDAAIKLIDNLLDEDGVMAKEVMAELLKVAEPFSGVIEVPCPDDWVGAVIGKHGAGLKAIQQETGTLLEYIDPEEAEAGGGGGDAAAAAVDVSEGAKEEDDEKAKLLKGFFRIKGKFENDCKLAAKRIEERLALVQRLDVHGFVMVPKASVGRLIGKGGANIKLLQRTSGASRITFDKEGGNKATSQACTVIAADIEGAIGAAKVILEAVPLESADARAELKTRMEDLGAHVLALKGGGSEEEKPVDATKEQAVAAHREKFGSECLQPDKQTKAVPADLAAVDFEVWLLQWAVASDRVYSDGGGRR